MNAEKQKLEKTQLSGRVRGMIILAVMVAVVGFVVITTRNDHSPLAFMLSLNDRPWEDKNFESPPAPKDLSFLVAEVGESPESSEGVPSYEYLKVKRGDTMAQIAKQRGISESNLRWENNIPRGREPKAGCQIWAPKLR